MTEPRLYYTETTHHGRLYSLALVVTHWGSEGTCLLERLSADRKAADLVENGEWRVTGEPGVLHIDMENPGDIHPVGHPRDIPDWYGLLDLLSAGLVDAGAADTFYPNGDC